MAGNWHLIGFATNAQWFVSRRSSMRMGTAILSPTVDGDIDMSYSSLNSDGSCWRMNNLAKKTDVPGKFSYTSLGNENDMWMVDMKYDEYALTQTIKTKGGEPNIVNKLYVRGVKLSAELKEKFRQFSLENGVLLENIAFLPQNAECLPA